MMNTATLFQGLGARDRALFLRCAPRDHRPAAWRGLWTALTHLGGASCTIAAAVLPLRVGGALGSAARHALVVLLVSHLVVQLVKRTVGRPRPSRRLACTALVQEPDAFSFPSGHAAAAMAVAIVYAAAFPSFGAILIPAALLVGASRVFLGVHYPSDVLMGQLIAVLTALPIVLR